MRRPAKARLDKARGGVEFISQWLRDGLGIIRDSSEVEALAATVPDSGGVFIVPAFAGLGAPHWDQYARGTITGITRGTTAGHIARAALEGIAFQVADVLDQHARSRRGEGRQSLGQREHVGRTGVG